MIRRCVIAGVLIGGLLFVGPQFRRAHAFSIREFFSPFFSSIRNGDLISVCIKQNGSMYMIGHGFTKEDCKTSDRIFSLGLVGPMGATGASGISGETGPTGATGAVGIPGKVGPIGSTGMPGSTGASGIQGNPGDAGPAGATGESGQIGSTGPTGLPGAIGATGSEGPMGRQGDSGPTGASGRQGEAGATGVQGDMGPTGAVGPTGSSGFGETGATGVSGPTGSTGPAGADGYTILSGSGNPNEGSDRFSASGAFTEDTSEADRQTLMPEGIVNALLVRVSTAPGAGKSWTITVRKNEANTALTCSISDANLTCSDAAHPVLFSSGDLLSILIHPGTPNPTSAGHLYWSVMVE